MIPKDVDFSFHNTDEEMGSDLAWCVDELTVRKGQIPGPTPRQSVPPQRLC